MSLVIQALANTDVLFVGFDSEKSDFVFCGSSEDDVRSSYARFLIAPDLLFFIATEDAKMGFKLRKVGSEEWNIQSLDAPILSVSGKDLDLIISRFLREEPIFKKIVKGN